jgi:hypothetical protein
MHPCLSALHPLRLSPSRPPTSPSPLL